MAEEEGEAVMPALSYAKSSDSLLAKEPPENLKSNRSRLIRLTHVHHLPRPILLPLVCTAIAANAIFANAVYSFPSWGPIIIQNLRLSASEGQTMLVMGVLGVYLCAAPVGHICDRKGPQFASLMAAAFNFIGFGGFGLILLKASSDTPNLYLYLSGCHFVVGAGTVCAYFSSITNATLSFPNFPTLALSLPLAFVGLSSLFISSIGKIPVLQNGPELDPAKFLLTLAVLIPVVNIFAALFLVVLPRPPSTISSTEEAGTDHLASTIDYPDAPAHLLDPTERTPLLIGGAEAVYAYAREEEENALADGGDVDSIVHVHWDTMRFLKNKGFWGFGLILFLVVGPAEMVLGSIGSIVTTLIPPESHFIALTATSPSPSDLRYKHVVIMSCCSTAARVFTGFSADFLAPISSKTGQHPRILLKRSTFAAVGIAVLIGAYLWGAYGLTTESGLWILSGVVGFVYGHIFVLTPAITSRHFGHGSFGLGWGLLSYFGAAGAAVFSYAYAWVLEAVAAKQAQAEGIDFVTQCYGRECFSATLALSAVGAFVGLIGMLILGRRWSV